MNLEGKKKIYRIQPLSRIADTAQFFILKVPQGEFLDLSKAQVSILLFLPMKTRSLIWLRTDHTSQQSDQPEFSATHTRTARGPSSFSQGKDLEQSRAV